MLEHDMVLTRSWNKQRHYNDATTRFCPFKHSYRETSEWGTWERYHLQPFVRRVGRMIHFKSYWLRSLLLSGLPRCFLALFPPRASEVENASSPNALHIITIRPDYIIQSPVYDKVNRFDDPKVANHPVSDLLLNTFSWPYGWAHLR